MTKTNTLKSDIRRMAVWTKTHATPGKIIEWCGIKFIYVQKDGVVSTFSAKQDFDQTIGAGMTAYLVSGKSGAGGLPKQQRREMAAFVRKFPAVPLPR